MADGATKYPLSFQDMILTLHNYWSARGCAILQPYDMRVGAGTFHPSTTLRSLGPEPWNVAYVQPSPHAPSVGDSQSSSTKRMSWSSGSMPIAASEPRYCSCRSAGDGFRIT